MNTTRARWIVLMAILWGLVGALSARELFQGSACVVPAGETVRGTLLVLCETLTLEGTVEGDVVGLAWRTHLSGSVSGGVYLAGGEAHLRGSVAHNLHYAGVVLTLQEGARVGGLFGGTLLTDIAAGATLDGNLLMVGYELRMGGSAAGELNFWGSALQVSGQVDGSVFASVGDPASDSGQIRALLLPFGFDVQLDRPGLVVTTSGQIGGDLTYSGLAEGIVAGVVAGETRYTQSQLPLPTLDEPATLAVYGGVLVQEFTALLVVGIACWLLVPRALQLPLQQLRTRPISSLSVGLVAFIVSFPIVLILALLGLAVVLVLLAIRLEGVAVAVGLVWGVGSAATVGGFYFIAIYVARAVVAWAVGRFLLRSLRGTMTARNLSLAGMVLGVGVVAVCVSLPVVGWLVNAAVLFLGLGAVLAVVAEQLRAWRETPLAAAPLASYRPIIMTHPNRATPSDADAPPLALPPAQPQGMDNLPEGFRWDFFND